MSMGRNLTADKCLLDPLLYWSASLDTRNETLSGAHPVTR